MRKHYHATAIAIHRPRVRGRSQGKCRCRCRYRRRDMGSNGRKGGPRCNRGGLGIRRKTEGLGMPRYIIRLGVIKEGSSGCVPVRQIDERALARGEQGHHATVEAQGPGHGHAAQLRGGGREREARGVGWCAWM